MCSVWLTLFDIGRVRNQLGYQRGVSLTAFIISRVLRLHLIIVFAAATGPDLQLLLLAAAHSAVVAAHHLARLGKTLSYPAVYPARIALAVRTATRWPLTPTGPENFKSAGIWRQKSSEAY